jgi:hypothetical protein
MFELTVIPKEALSTVIGTRQAKNFNLFSLRQHFIIPNGQQPYPKKDSTLFLGRNSSAKKNLRFVWQA